MARHADEKRRLLASVRSLLANGATEYEQLDALEDDSVGVVELRGMRASIIQDEIESASADTPAEIFVRFRLRMNACISDLDKVIASATRQSSAIALNAAVGAIKAKASILGSVLDRGQTLGVIHKAPKTNVTIAGVLIADASVSDLKRLVATRTAHLESIAARSTMTDYLAEPPGELYYDAVPDVPKLEPKPPPKTVSARVRRKKVLAP